MQLEILDVSDRFPPVLHEIALGSSWATFYHSATWIESLLKSYPSMECRCIVAVEDGRYAGYLPFFVVARKVGRAIWSMPFGTYGGPIGDESERVALLEKFVAMRREGGVHEVGYVDYENRMRTPGFRREVSVTHLIELDGGFEGVWTNLFDKAKRRQTRKAQREGIRVVEASTAEEVKAYYQIYSQRSEEWGQRLRYPEELFVDLFVRGGGTVRLFLAYTEDRLLGGHFNFYFKKSVIAWNGVTTRDSRSVQASTLLYSTCIRHACENGYLHYNLGSSLGKASLVAYKESLGGVAHRYQVVRWRSLAGRIAATVRRYVPGW